MRATTPVLELQLSPPSTEAKCRSALYEALEGMSVKPPTYEELHKWEKALESKSSVPQIRTATEMLHENVDRALGKGKFHTIIFAEYQRILDKNSPSYIRPYALVQCEPAIVEQMLSAKCPFESGKPCPYPDCYCADRMGDACDHISTALRLAGRLWNDVAEAQVLNSSPEYKARVADRRQRFAERHLKQWVRPIAERIFQEASSSFYVSAALLIDALISYE